MADKHKEGLKRLGIAIGVPWIAWWGYKLVDDYNDLQRATYQRDITGLTTLSHGTEAWRTAAADALRQDLLWALVPLLALILAVWVYRGFKPRS